VPGICEPCISFRIARSRTHVVPNRPRSTASAWSIRSTKAAFAGLDAAFRRDRRTFARPVLGDLAGSGTVMAEMREPPTLAPSLPTGRRAYGKSYMPGATRPSL